MIRKPFQSCLGKDAVYNFINSTIEQSNYCANIMKKTFTQRTCDD